MLNLSKVTFYTILIRIITLVLRLSLILILGNYYSADFVGVYGLIAALVAICSTFLTFGFFNYSTLEILEKNITEDTKVFANHFFFICCMGIIFTPFVIMAFGYSNIPNDLFFLVIFVLVFETLSLEFSRLLVALKNPVGCYIVSFIHSSFWVFGLIYFSFTNQIVAMDMLLLLWGLSGVLASLIGLYLIKRGVQGTIFNLDLISIDWIKNGIFFSLPLLIASFGHVINQYVGRFFLSNYSSISDIGYYTIYFQISAIILIVVEVFQNIYLPTYVENFSSNKKNNFYEYFMIFLISTLVFLLLLFEDFLFDIINPNLLTKLDTMHVLLFAMATLSFASVLKNRLYVKRLQYMTMYSYAIAMFLSFISNYFLVPTYGILGSAYSMLISSMGLCIIIYFFDIISSWSASE